MLGAWGLIFHRPDLGTALLTAPLKEHPYTHKMRIDQESNQNKCTDIGWWLGAPGWLAVGGAGEGVPLVHSVWISPR